MTARFKEGDVVKRRSSDEHRVVTLVTDSFYYFVDYQPDDGFFMNPTKSAVAHQFMEQTFTKVGEIDDLGSFQSAVVEVNQLHSKAFARAEELFATHKINFTE